MAAPTAETILTSDFFLELQRKYISEGEEYYEIGRFIGLYKEEFALHALLNYKGLQFFDELANMTNVDLASYTYALIGESLKRIFDALVDVKYNPLENYFTERTMETDASNTQSKTGNKDVQKTGQVTSAQSGTKTRTYNNQTNTGQATSFEDPVNFANVSKDTLTGNVQDTYTGYGSTTTYGTPSAPMSEKTVYDVTTEDEGGESVEEHRSGNSGIFSKQDLTQRELTLRQNNLFMKTAVRMIVDAFNTGVW